MASEPKNEKEERTGRRQQTKDSRKQTEDGRRTKMVRYIIGLATKLVNAGKWWSTRGGGLRETQECRLVHLVGSVIF